MSAPGPIRTEAELDDRLSEPTPEVVAALGRMPGDILVLGVAGKMGPTLARMAKRASDAAGVRRRVIGVSRFSAGGEESLRAHGIDTIRCDLLDASAVGRLPDATHAFFLAGRKFGSTSDEAATWATNAYLPGVVCDRFRRSRIVALSTGNVYGLVPVAGGGSREQDPPRPIGEYAMSCLGRERVFEHFSRSNGTPVTLVRLNYACELRYGVLVDLARKVWAGESIDLETGFFNTIWQGDACAMTLLALEHAAAPASILNVTGSEVLSVRSVAERFGRRMNRPVRFAGAEADTALLSDGRRARELFGLPRVTTDQLIEWVADWVIRGGRFLDKPTHFESRDGRF
ncbi:MAG: NAD(P)-dependent oxidoreductase [Zavarzinella sp.]|nr:NAD(P)-dependent oxidoreductase [Zavarzinella sp.]